MADVNGVLQIEMRDHRGKIVGVVIHIVAVGDLGRAAMAAPIMGDDAIAVIEKEQHLRVPVVGRQRPTMTEHDGLTLAPVFVKNFNAIFGFDEHEMPFRNRTTA